MVEFITENELFDYQAFSDDVDIQHLAREAVEHSTKLYPIYIMMHYHNGEQLTKEQIDWLELLIDFVAYYDADITLVLNEQDLQTFRDYDEDNNFKYLVHSCYDSSNELSNNIARIKNFILKSAASRFGNKNINWIYLIEEDVKINRFTQQRFVECTHVQDVAISFAIWQYLTTKKAYSFLKDENVVGLSGITESKNKFQEFIIDKALMTSALLINLSECNRKHIEYDLMSDIMEDEDFNVSMFANGLHVAGIGWPLSLTRLNHEYRTSRKLSNLAINLWAKWGDKIVKKLFVDNNQIKPLIASDFSNIIEEFNSSSKHRIQWPKNEVVLAEYLTKKRDIVS